MANELDHYRQLLTDDRREVHPLAVEARAVLAASVTSPPDWRGLCEELASHLQGRKDCEVGWPGEDPEQDLLDRARAALAQPEPEDDVALLRAALEATAAQRRAEDDARIALAQPEPEVVGPTRRQLILLADAMGMASAGDAAEYARAVLARYGRPAPAPAEGEVAELVDWLRGANWDRQRQTLATRAADLLERQAAPVPAVEALAVRPLLEQVAAIGDCISEQTVGHVRALADRAAAWLSENPPGNPVAIEPRGCPTPGACSCVELPAQAPAGERQAAPVAVAVSDRLPQPEDCDAEGQCWAWDYLAERWGLWPLESIADGFYHWLPFNALPLPSGEVDE